MHADLHSDNRAIGSEGGPVNLADRGGAEWLGIERGEYRLAWPAGLFQDCLVHNLSWPWRHSILEVPEFLDPYVRESIRHTRGDLPILSVHPLKIFECLDDVRRIASVERTPLLLSQLRIWLRDGVLQFHTTVHDDNWPDLAV